MSSYTLFCVCEPGCSMCEKEVILNIKVNSKNNSMWKTHAWYLKKILKIVLITIIQCFLPRNSFTPGSTWPYLEMCWTGTIDYRDSPGVEMGEARDTVKEPVLYKQPPWPFVLTAVHIETPPIVLGHPELTAASWLRVSPLRSWPCYKMTGEEHLPSFLPICFMLGNLTSYRIEQQPGTQKDLIMCLKEMGGRGRCISKPAWSTGWVPGQPRRHKWKSKSLSWQIKK